MHSVAAPGLRELLLTEQKRNGALYLKAMSGALTQEIIQFTAQMEIYLNNDQIAHLDMEINKNNGNEL